MSHVTESSPSQSAIDFGPGVNVTQHTPEPAIIVVCEHASKWIPEALNGLGLNDALAQSHIAWDPGALGVAEGLARRLGAVLVQGRVSRLVYDCNRPPDAPSAIPETSEIHDIPGNQRLDATQRSARINGVYAPFQQALTGQIRRHKARLRLLVTIHSFTPRFKGQPREVQLGILHGQDNSLAHAMMRTLPAPVAYDTRLNEPYSAKDGVTHTLDEHGARNGLPNVMIEIRNDLIATPDQQDRAATYLANWIQATLAGFQAEGDAS